MSALILPSAGTQAVFAPRLEASGTVKTLKHRVAEVPVTDGLVNVLDLPAPLIEPFGRFMRKRVPAGTFRVKLEHWQEFCATLGL
ncbi:MAG: hypothetical protein HY749_16340 [Gammaproteobacteria bacterium]|nr:hypothetical protein [Gammaproteobacteria bacterium]